MWSSSWVRCWVSKKLCAVVSKLHSLLNFFLVFCYKLYGDIIRKSLLSICMYTYDFFKLAWRVGAFLFPVFFADKCNEAISNAFKEFWLKEQIASTEDNKTGVAICFSYLRYYRNNTCGISMWIIYDCSAFCIYVLETQTTWVVWTYFPRRLTTYNIINVFSYFFIFSRPIHRRILAIDSHPQWSSVGEIQLHRAVHDRYIVQLRVKENCLLLFLCLVAYYGMIVFIWLMGYWTWACPRRTVRLFRFLPLNTTLYCFLMCFIL